VSVEESQPVEPPVEQATGSEPDILHPAITQHSGGFPVVGIGSSAGGLAALEALFSSLPTDTDLGMAFVLVQHLDPDHKSLLTELLGRHTTMDVHEVQDGVRVEPNSVYVIPPNHGLSIMNGVLHLFGREANPGLWLPIDSFFRSLAEDMCERAICVVLSGTGSDGTLGLRAVKGAGGTAFAQDPDTADYDGMPCSAIATGQVDFVLPPSDIAVRLVTYATGMLVRSTAEKRTRLPDGFGKVLVLLRERTGHDFSGYKSSTIHRRIERRMALSQIEQFEGYVEYLRREPQEIDSLYRDLLIGVTSFFRDHEAFELLAQSAISELLAREDPSIAMRVWVPGCSTGEEAYSIAMLIREQMDALSIQSRVQIFATDIDEVSVSKARAGRFPQSIAADVSAERLQRFFLPQDKADGFYRINSYIREMIIFSEHDVLSDPPFSRVDLISCRNLLIYMEGAPQQKLMSIFHYALNPGGFLFLGTSETVGAADSFFSVIDRKQKLYRSLDDAPGAGRAISGSSRARVWHEAQPKAAQTIEPASGEGWRVFAEHALVQHCAPVAVLVDELGDVLYLHGRTGDYLEPAPGEAGMNVHTMARDGLRDELSSALLSAVSSGGIERREGVRVKSSGTHTELTLIVRPVPVAGQPRSTRRVFLVVFDSADAHTGPSSSRSVWSTAIGGRRAWTAHIDGHVEELERELVAKEEHLQATLEEMQTTNEELSSTNEEMQSVNEELQSTNEEMETSREELQSVNEELITVNVELEQKLVDLAHVNNDLNNLMRSTDIGTIFVDQELYIRRFTPAMTRIMRLIDTDAGRPVGDIASNLMDYDEFQDDIQAVLDTLEVRELELQAISGAWYLMRIRPYQTTENVIDGAVITFSDVTELKLTQRTLEDVRASDRLKVVLDDSRDAITVQDLKGRILAWNHGATRVYGWTEAEALAMNVSELIASDDKQSELERVLALSQSSKLEPYRTWRKSKENGPREVMMTATALLDKDGETYAIATTEREVGPDAR